MPQLLDKLIVQAKAEAREELRKLILSFNGLAGLYILKEEVCYGCGSAMYMTYLCVISFLFLMVTFGISQWSMAEETYQQAISTWTDYKAKEVCTHT